MEIDNISPTKADCSSNQLQPAAVFNDVERPTPTLKSIFCRQFNCPPSEYEDRIFKKLLYRHARPLAGLVRKLNPDFFKEDIKFLHYLGEAEDYFEAAASIADFRGANVSRGHNLRRFLRIRVSGRLAGRLVKNIFSGRS